MESSAVARATTLAPRTEKARGRWEKDSGKGIMMDWGRLDVGAERGEAWLWQEEEEFGPGLMSP